MVAGQPMARRSWCRNHPCNPRDAIISLVVRPDGAVAELDGVRALAVAWVVSHHSYNGLLNLAKAMDPDFESPVGLDGYLTEWFTAPVRAGQAGVDVFFVLSGFLIAFLLGKEIRRSGSVHGLRFLSRRWVRIVPAYVATIVLYCALTWRPCLRWGWTNLLFINNFVGPQMFEGTGGKDGLNSADAGCMGHSWSIAVEFQMYLVSPALALLMSWLGRWHWLVPATGILACTWLRWALWHSVESFAALETAVYNKPYARVAPYFVGMQVAHLVGPALDAARRGRAWAVPCARLAPVAYWLGVAGWVAGSFAFALWRPQLDPMFIRFDDTAQRPATALAAAVFRPLFGLSVGLVLFALIVAKLDRDAPPPAGGHVAASAAETACAGPVDSVGLPPPATTEEPQSESTDSAGPGLELIGLLRVPAGASPAPSAPDLLSAQEGQGAELGEKEEKAGEAAGAGGSAFPRGSRSAEPGAGAVCGQGRADPLWWCPRCAVGRWPDSALSLGWFLSLRGWLPLARLSYSVYLLQWMGILGAEWVVGWSKEDSADELWLRFMAVSGLGLLLAMGIALLIYTLVERPFMLLRERCTCTAAAEQHQGATRE